jgi:hypothetical protein
MREYDKANAMDELEVDVEEEEENRLLLLVCVNVNSDSVGPQGASRLQKSHRGIAPSPPLVPSRESLPLV